MAKLKSEKEIGIFIKEKLHELNMRQADLARQIADMMGDSSYKNQLKDNISKWIAGKRRPGVEYIFYLARALHVSVEEILLAGDVCEKYDTRPYTLYALAKSGDTNAADEMFNSITASGSAVAAHYDEYDKTLLDYIVKFSNIKLAHYLLEKGYIGFNSSFLSDNLMRVGDMWQTGALDLIKLAIKNDDELVFRKAIERTTRVCISFGDNYNYSAYWSENKMYDSMPFTYDMLIDILSTEKILQYIITPFIPTEAEWLALNNGIYFHYQINNTKKSYSETLTFLFNPILNVAVKNNHQNVDKLIKIGVEHNKRVLSWLRKYSRGVSYRLNKNGSISDFRNYGCLAIVAGVMNKQYDEKQHDGLYSLTEEARVFSVEQAERR